MTIRKALTNRDIKEFLERAAGQKTQEAQVFVLLDLLKKYTNEPLAPNIRIDNGPL
jgi:hypothetical protein